jgi:transcriptional regulator with XRE-family HTH domain
MMSHMDGGDRMERLGNLIRRRRSALGLDIAPTAQNIEMSPATWAKVERGGSVKRTSTYGRIEQVLRWREGSILDYLEGGPEPTAADGLLAIAPDGDGGTIEIHEIQGEVPGALPPEYWKLSDDDRALIDQLRETIDQLIRRMAATQSE